MKIKEEDIFNFGIDYLEIYCFPRNIEEFIPGLIRGLDTDNSPITTLTYGGKEFIIQKHEVPKYQFKLTFTFDSVPCFAYYRGDIDLLTNINTRDIFTVYGLSFAVLEFDFILSFFEKFFRFERFRRIDLAMDIKSSLLEHLEEYKKRDIKGSNMYGSRGILETYYLGEKKNSLNRNKLIRIYDKKRDIIKKKKQRWYVEYLEERQDITRIEIEIRRDLLMNFPYSQIKNSEYLFSLFCTYMEKHTQVFKSLDYTKTSLQRNKNKNLDLNTLNSSNVFDSRYLKMFLGIAKNIKQLGYCPTKILLDSELYEDITIDSIDNILTSSKIEKIFSQD